jgi:hypothetical protein
MLPYAFAAFVLLFGASQLLLVLRWTRQLQRKHSARYGFLEIFFLFFKPQFQVNFEPEFWKDFVPLQNRMSVYGLAFGGMMFLLLFASIVVRGLMR